MANPAFDAALLLRGLRAMDAALGESYDVMSHTCVPSPVVYSPTFPEKGIDFRQYQGITGVQNSWRGWMYEDGGAGKLKAAVHEDVEANVVEAFGILERCDKSKDGLVTSGEWIDCQKGKSADDQLFDLEYLLALNNVTGKMLMLEKDQPLNPADPNTYPELIQSRNDLATLKTEKDKEISNVTTQLEKSREEAELYQTLTYGFGGGLGIFVLGAVAFSIATRNTSRKDGRKPLHPDAARAIRNDQNVDAGIPRPAPAVAPAVATTPAPADVKIKIVNEAPAAAVKTQLAAPSTYDDILKGFNEPPAPKKDSVSPFQAFLNAPLAEDALLARLAKFDAKLVDFYRKNFLIDGAPLATIGDLIARIAVIRPDALIKVEEEVTKAKLDDNALKSRLPLALIIHASR